MREHENAWKGVFLEGRLHARTSKKGTKSAQNEQKGIFPKYGRNTRDKVCLVNFGIPH